VSFYKFCAAKWCVITDVYGTVLFQQHHLPHQDESGCLEAVEIDSTLPIKQHYFIFRLGNITSKLIPIKAALLPSSKKLNEISTLNNSSYFSPRTTLTQNLLMGVLRRMARLKGQDLNYQHYENLIIGFEYSL